MRKENEASLIPEDCAPNHRCLQAKEHKAASHAAPSCAALNGSACAAQGGTCGSTVYGVVRSYLQVGDLLVQRLLTVQGGGQLAVLLLQVLLGAQGG